MTRRPFAHDAVLAMDPAEDDRAPGGAITVALCGSWDHEPPCPLAPHHTRAERTGDEVRLRILFAAAPDDEQRVRSAIDGALARGEGGTPQGGGTRVATAQRRGVRGAPGGAGARGPTRRGPPRPVNRAEPCRTAGRVIATCSFCARPLAAWVRKARTLGASWARIGNALGVTRQSAWERFAAAD